MCESLEPLFLDITVCASMSCSFSPSGFRRHLHMFSSVGQASPCRRSSATAPRSTDMRVRGRKSTGGVFSRRIPAIIRQRYSPVYLLFRWQFFNNPRSLCISIASVCVRQGAPPPILQSSPRRSGATSSSCAASCGTAAAPSSTPSTSPLTAAPVPAPPPVTRSVPVFRPPPSPRPKKTTKPKPS